MHWVFAYGSNMHLPDVARWCRERQVSPIEPARIERAMLPGHRLIWNYYSDARGSGAANVERASASDLPGLALQIDDAALASLDRKEGHPRRYRRRPESITLHSGECPTAWVYAVRPEYRSPEVVLPSAEYLGLLLAAAEHHGFPAEYIAELRGLRQAVSSLRRG